MPTPTDASPSPAWIITGPTSGIGHRTALELAGHGTVVLVGRDPRKLRGVEAGINAQAGGHAVSVVCDFSDIPSVRLAAAQIIALGLPLAGLLNNAGIMPNRAEKTPQGWDLVRHLQAGQPRHRSRLRTRNPEAPLHRGRTRLQSRHRPWR
jgi:NAD(P)-dependent dehydrogenase (short-subunit alcohol dehydrogenase family)